MLAALAPGQTFHIDTWNGPRVTLVPATVVSYTDGLATLRMPDGKLTTLRDSQ